MNEILAKLDALEASLADLREAIAQLQGPALEEPQVEDQLKLEPRPDRLADLIPYGTYPIELWSYSNEFHPMVGARPGRFLADWAFSVDNVAVDGDLFRLSLTDKKMGGLNYEIQKKLAPTSGHYRVHCQLPAVIPPGVVVAPLWLTSHKGHEVGFEFFHDRAEVNLHNGRGGFTLGQVPGSWAGREVLTEIDRHDGRLIISLCDLMTEETFEWVVTQKSLVEFAALAAKLRRFVPHDLEIPNQLTGMYPISEIYVSRHSRWAGEFIGLPETTPVELVLKNYAIRL